MNDKKLKHLTQCMPMLLASGLITVSILFPEVAHATSPGGAGLPWEAPIATIVNSFLGPIALGMVLIGMVGGVWGFMTGGEINGFVRSMVVMVLAGSVLASARPFVQQLFNVGTGLG
ncbi:TrbC/VirB2 family protein [Vampirovibrio sp.]|uniref:TrbC/VirB2 family protein n=1 Tax=Vampirovibrio sp. TaxID=2717857 RepID=UPI0035942256